MPVVTVTLIEGYAEGVRARLGEGLTRAVRSVLEPPPDGITTIVHEVPAANYRRGGVARTPAPPPEPATDIVRRFLAAMEARDLATARSMLAPGFAMTFPGGATFTRLEELVDFAAARYRFVRKTYERFDEAPGLEDTVVYCFGTLSGEWPDGGGFADIRFIDRFSVRGGRLLDQHVWNDLAEHRSGR